MEMDMSAPERDSAETDRRSFIGMFSKAAVVAPPVITAMLSTSLASPAIAKSTGGSKGNNGLGNGPDPQPPGNPKVNDGAGSGPGNPGNGGGNGNSGGNGNGNGNSGSSGSGKPKKG
jgi:hypothetical protein